MAVAEGVKATSTLKYWEASLAWKNIGDWAANWTTGSFIRECRRLCLDQGRVGFLADTLLDDVIHDRERSPLEMPAEVLAFITASLKTQDLGQVVNHSNI